MLRLRACVLSHIFSSSSTFPASQLRRLLSATARAPPLSPNQAFAVGDYLVDTCGLTQAQAIRASTKLSHFKSRAKPDAVLAFLAGLGLSSADVAAAVVKDPQLLCAKVEKTLASNVAGLIGLGVSGSEIARLASLAPGSFRSRPAVSNLPYYLSLLGSYDNLLRMLRKNSSFLARCPEKAAKPNVTLLQECELGACDIAKLCIVQPWLLTTNLEQVQAMVARVEAIGVPRGSGMFRQALQAVAFLSDDIIAARVEFLKKTLGWSDAEVGVAVCKFPTLLLKPKEMLQRKSEFLFFQVGLEPDYIAHRPALLCYSLEGRLKPRYYAVKFLMENGLLDHDRSYYTAVSVTEKVFLEKYISPHNEAAPYLVEDYATACKGELPARFRFT